MPSPRLCCIETNNLKNRFEQILGQKSKNTSPNQEPISFRIPPEGSTKTLLSQAKARGQVTVVGRPACVCIPGAPRNLPVCEMISWFLLHVSNVYPTKNWMELTAEQRLERNLLSFGKNRTIPCVQDRNFYRCFMKEKISYQSYYCTFSS
ncbi:uncharacterized protein AAG666_008674 isoform 4-T14 [Megaptera novaeangliae]